MTSAALKLLRLLRILRNSGRSDFVPGTTTADGFVFIHASDWFALPFAPALAVVAGGTPLAVLFRLLAASVGSLEGVGDVGRARVPMAVLLRRAVAVPVFCAKRGILLGLWPPAVRFADAVAVAPVTAAAGFRTPFVVAIDRVTRVCGRVCSNAG